MLRLLFSFEVIADLRIVFGCISFFIAFAAVSCSTLFSIVKLDISVLGDECFLGISRKLKYCC